MLIEYPHGVQCSIYYSSTFEVTIWITYFPSISNAYPIFIMGTLTTFPLVWIPCDTLDLHYILLMISILM